MLSKTAQIVVRIREMVLRGELESGRRLNEIALAGRLGASSSLVGDALSVLAKEGILAEPSPREFLVREVNLREIMEAIDMRGTLEARALRMLAGNGLSRRLLQSLYACLRDGDEIFVKRHLVASDAAKYDAMNDRFHSLLVQGAGNRAIARAIKLNNRTPFAAAHATAFGELDLVRAYDSLSYAHHQHHEIVDALANGQRARVAALMVEHAHEAKISLNMNLRPWQPASHAGGSSRAVS